MDELDQTKSVCCDVKQMCGKTLRDGVFVISISSTVISLVASLLSVVSLLQMTHDHVLYNTSPVSALNMVFALVCVSVSVYQIIISLLLLWQNLKTGGNIFLCSLWYVSHLTILPLYLALFVAGVAVCCLKERYFSALVISVVGIAYEGIFTYFAVVVNSYLHSLDQFRYF